MSSSSESAQNSFSDNVPLICVDCRHREEGPVIYAKRQPNGSISQCTAIKLIRGPVDPATVKPTPSPPYITPDIINFNPHPLCKDAVDAEGKCGRKKSASFLKNLMG